MQLPRLPSMSLLSNGENFYKVQCATCKLHVRCCIIKFYNKMINNSGLTVSGSLSYSFLVGNIS